MILPDCMAPDGADPCKGYQELRDEIERLRAALIPLARQAEFYKPEVPHFEQVKVPLDLLRVARAAIDGPLPSIEEFGR